MYASFLFPLVKDAETFNHRGQCADVRLDLSQDAKEVTPQRSNSNKLTVAFLN